MSRAGDPAPAGTIVHAVRQNVFRPERRFRLGGDALEWEDARGAGRLPYAEVTGVRLFVAPLGAGVLRRCVLRHRGGRLVVQGTHYARLGVTEDRSATYAPLVRELLGRIARASPGVRMVAGQGRAIHLMWIALGGLLALALAVGAFAMLAGGLPWQGMAQIAGLLLAVPLVWHVLRRGGPRPLDPDAIPPDLLG